MPWEGGKQRRDDIGRAGGRAGGSNNNSNGNKYNDRGRRFNIMKYILQLLGDGKGGGRVVRAGLRLAVWPKWGGGWRMAQAGAITQPWGGQGLDRRDPHIPCKN